MNNEVVKLQHNKLRAIINNKRLKEQALAARRNNNWKKTPVFIICRDRLTPLKELIHWCEKNGLTTIFLIDNDSLYPPLVKFLSTTSYQVIRTGKNIGHTVPWQEGVVKTLAYGQYYIVSDPDVIPDTACPRDVIPYLYQLHAKYIEFQKIGLGLSINNLPDSFALKSHVIEWEKQFWTEEIEQNVFIAGVDTTFALYKPYTHFYQLHPSLRTGKPYVASHLPWYIDSNNLDPEEVFYRLHANEHITSWNTNELVGRYKKELSKK